MTRSILILGGTTDARLLAGRLGEDSSYRILLSMAGRTISPVEQPVPMRSGGFGGAAGLADFIRAGNFDILVDATHPYAARISANAVEASKRAGVPLIRLSRPAWQRQPGDNWQSVESIDQAVVALGGQGRCVFLALGRQELLPFEAAPQHNYLIRSVDPVEPPLKLPDARYITARGPFATEDEIRMLEENRIEVVISKNSGGAASYGKIEAARQLHLPVIMIERPRQSHDTPATSVTVPDIATALTAIHHQFSLFEKRGE
ncbi:UNVERIFIED_ORG: precorrin-6A/cobalt-precorrin-6A reductase [Rhizobium sp. SORGH_AS260]|uniref:cobalt-precorrin-6A reductase n=1 Tax=Agrobacterium sp. SORGH_AS_0440 TaxID=3041757 RepID=UPI0027821206|nr:cobalt-precorrin-6A reductase [Agrobacterium sp. SORGH_AS_0440]MDP9734419.1 precorrin-6A/cobalt-precorrin-6A reductase [Rhizobium sp. SORGH_AS_0285]MDP9756450.1 precorrin-6A/cobalt-precorrin-6A reductase [Rhizobium sp. SORGH_AS_0260]MDR6083604.1 precorrin-6A/cobalt-precorrin-6A reductase [Agrobacterium sp. SORGH_AS_0440]